MQYPLQYPLSTRQVRPCDKSGKRQDSYSVAFHIEPTFRILKPDEEVKTVYSVHAFAHKVLDQM
jgi:hypothetical protein